MLAWTVLHRIVPPVWMICVWVFTFAEIVIYYIIGVYRTITKPCSGLLQVGTSAGITRQDCRKQSEGQILLQAWQQHNVYSLRRLREMLGDALCTRNYFQFQTTVLDTDKEAGDEERSMKDTTTTVLTVYRRNHTGIDITCLVHQLLRLYL